MFRAALLAALCATSVQADSCKNRPHSQKNCVRVLACWDGQTQWFDGQARGWDQGTVTGSLSTSPSKDEQSCTGWWRSGGPMGVGLGQITCGALTADVIYHTQDNDTGTTIGSGRDSTGATLQLWSGLNVLDFLKDDGGNPRLPCAPTVQLLS